MVLLGVIFEFLGKRGRNGAKLAEKGAKMGQERPQTGSKRPKIGPRWPKIVPKGPPDGFQDGLQKVKHGPRLAKMAQDGQR